ncbi:hypothetical protein NL676_025783 [Syzygium grande]|nr:hypothetical protein NL676_025783 [Syzygium grande]
MDHEQLVSMTISMTILSQGWLAMWTLMVRDAHRDLGGVRHDSSRPRLVGNVDTHAARDGGIGLVGAGVAAAVGGDRRGSNGGRKLLTATGLVVSKQCGHDGEAARAREIGNRGTLEKIDMRECVQIRQVPISASSMRSLKTVVFDEEVSSGWQEVVKPREDVQVHFVDKCFSLDWLDC